MVGAINEIVVRWLVIKSLGSSRGAADALRVILLRSIGDPSSVLTGEASR
jgi:hypothetical protein